MFFQRNETSIETVFASRSTIETVTKVNEKAKGLKQNRVWYCCRRLAFGLAKTTVSRLGPFGGT